MKTGKYYFDKLSEKEQKQYLEMVIKERRYFLFNTTSFSLNGFLSKSFVWSETPQGHDYWQQISNRKLE